MNLNLEKQQPCSERKPTRIFEFEGKKVSVFEKKEGIISLQNLDSLAGQNQKGEMVPKKVLLIDFKTLEVVPENQDYSFQNFINLGIHRLAGYLEDYNVPVNIVRYGGMKDKMEELLSLVSECDIVGVSNLTSQVEDTYKLCLEIKKRFGNSKLIIGGGEHYLGFDEILADQENTGIDVCCQGQGEMPLLALALGKSVQEVGSLAYRESNAGGDISITKNNRFNRLIDVAKPEQQGELGILNTRPASEFTEEEISSPPPFNELNGLQDFKFEGTFATQTGSGCLYGCDFCPSKKFFGAGYEAHLGVAKEEILNFKKKFPNLQEVFLTFTDAMVNSDENHLRAIIDLMGEVNKEKGPKISWFCYLSAPRRLASATQEQVKEWGDKWNGILSDMAKAGCIMGAVGVEEVIYDRNKIHHKGQDVDTASEFVDIVGKHMLARTLLIMGAPEHFYLDRSKTLKDSEYLDSKYSSDRDLVKGEILDFMKKHPQALFRMNPWTLVYGTDNYHKYEDCLSVDMSDPQNLKLLDHLHSTIDPEKMYSHLEKELNIVIPEEKRWVKNQQVWFELMEEIMFEYLQSPEYLACLDLLKEKETAGKKGLLYKIALKFKNNVLSQIDNNIKNRLK